MLTQDDLNRLDDILSDIIDKQDYYLGKFGSFVKDRVCQILASRHPHLQRNAVFGDTVRSLFRTEFMTFLIENPELFAKKMPYPFIDTLGSIKKLKARPDYYKIAWIGDKAFVDITKIPDHASHKDVMTLTINSIKNPIDDSSEKQRKLLPEGYFWLAPKDVALAMMDDFDPDTLTLRGEWLALLKKKKSKQHEKKQAFIKSIESLLSPTMILKCMSSEQPLPPDGDKNNFDEEIITQPKWKEYLRYAIKTIFLELNCQTRDEVMDCYTRIHKVLMFRNERLSRSERTFKNNLIRGITSATATFEYIQSRFSYRMNLTAEEFIGAFRRGIMLQVKDINLKNPAYAFMKHHVHQSMKRIKRMKLTDSEKSRYENILCHEALLIRYSNIKPCCDVFELKKLAEDITDSSNALKIVEVTLLKNSVVKNNLTERESPRKLDFDFIDDDAKYHYQFSSEEFKYNPYIKSIDRAKEFATKGLKQAVDSLKQHRNKQFPWFDIATNTLTNFGFFGNLTLDHRVVVIEAVMTGNTDRLLKIANETKNEFIKSSSWMKRVLRLSALNSFLCVAVAAPFPDEYLKNQQNVLTALFDIFSSIDIQQYDVVPEYISTLDTLSFLSTELRREDLLKIIKNNRLDFPLNRSYSQSRISYGILDDHRESLKSALLSITCPDERRLFTLYAISIHPSNYLISIIIEDAEDWIGKIDTRFERGLKAILRRYFYNNDIDPFTYLSLCPEWHQAYIMEIMSE